MTINTPCIVNLIQRWFGELPVRVFGTMTQNEFIACVENKDDNFVNKIQEPQRSFFLWLVELLLDVARKEPVNKMGPGNIGTLFMKRDYLFSSNHYITTTHIYTALVVAPVLAPLPEGNPMASLVLTGKVVGVLERYLIKRLEEERNNGAKTNNNNTSKSALTASSSSATSTTSSTTTTSTTSTSNGYYNNNNRTGGNDNYGFDIDLGDLAGGGEEEYYQHEEDIGSYDENGQQHYEHYYEEGEGTY